MMWRRLCAAEDGIARVATTRFFPIVLPEWHAGARARRLLLHARSAAEHKLGRVALHDLDRVEAVAHHHSAQLTVGRAQVRPPLGLKLLS